ncbi:hypothetical protein P389DRAFT_209107 [Cystobasidium minutum MCA 4210]|uniref:uncharacterized protein n=1 Tax=Cystobasidium minutum MCA 4210 TaxID=1397322 RepID=UPI0034CFED9B|eukprot:jgi/Rhomi1/209107/estExt_Genemark1.C_2_t20411
MATKPQLAFIRRYTCLYTRDLAKKAKAWHDGYLVFHHLNAKMVLLSDNFVILDECFFRAPGLGIMRDIPKDYKLPSDTQVSFEKHIATLDEAVYEEQKDISEIYQKKRKNAADLDEFVDSDGDATKSGPKSVKRPCNTASPGPREQTAPPRARPGWIYRISNASAESPKALTTVTPSRQNPNTSTPLLARQVSNQVMPMRPLHVNTSQRQSFTSAPRATTPFKPPSFVNAGSNSSPVSARPSSVPRRTLGSTRPSSMLARQTLQAEWAKYADALPNCAVKSKASYSHSTSSRHNPKPPQSDEERAKHLERIRNQPEPEIIPVQQTKPPCEKDDPANWLFG